MTKRAHPRLLDRNWLKERIDHGLSDHEIGSVLECDEGTVKSHREDHEIDTRVREEKSLLEDTDWLEGQFYSNERGVHAIAEDLEVNRGEVWRALYRAKIGREKLISDRHRRLKNANWIRKQVFVNERSDKQIARPYKNLTSREVREARATHQIIRPGVDSALIQSQELLEEMWREELLSVGEIADQADTDNDHVRRRLDHFELL